MPTLVGPPRPPARLSTASRRGVARELREQRLRLRQVDRVEPLSEPPVDVREQRVSVPRFSLPHPHLAQARRRAELECLRPLPPGNLEGLTKGGLGRLLRGRAGRGRLTVGLASRAMDLPR